MVNQERDCFEIFIRLNSCHTDWSCYFLLTVEAPTADLQIGSLSLCLVVHPHFVTEHLEDALMELSSLACLRQHLKRG